MINPNYNLFGICLTVKQVVRNNGHSYEIPVTLVFLTYFPFFMFFLDLLNLTKSNVLLIQSLSTLTISE